MTVLVFDSGIGGLSVLREARMLMHEQHFVYVGDDAGFPYGEWEANALTDRITTLFEGLVEHYRPTLAIVACNTASTLIMPALRARFEVPFVGIVPAIKPAAERSASRLISVLATPGTIRTATIHTLIARYAAHCDVTLVGATRLARLAEQYMQGQTIDTDILQAEIAPCFVEHAGKRTDIITLGCTHYPFLVNPMRKLAPWPVDWLDPAEAVARQAQTRLIERIGETQKHTHGTKGRRTDTAIMTSGAPPPPIGRLLSSFGLQLQPPISCIQRT